MPTLKPWPSRLRLRRGIRIAGAFLLIAALFSATLHNEVLYAVLGNFWRKLFSVAGIPPQASAGLHSSVIGQVTNTPRDAPAILTYGALYVGTCVVLLLLLLPRRPQRRAAMIFYGCATLGFIALLLAGKLGSPVLLQLSSQLIHFIVSPLPVVVLVPLLRWYLPHKHSSQ